MSARVKPQLAFQPYFSPAFLVICVLLTQMNVCLSTSLSLLVLFYFNFLIFVIFKNLGIIGHFPFFVSAIGGSFFRYFFSHI